MSSKFFTNVGDNTLLNKLKGVLENNEITNLDILVAYFYASGYFKLRPHLEGLGTIRILIGINTDQLIGGAHEKSLRHNASNDEVQRNYLTSLTEEVNKADYDQEVEEGIKKFLDDLIEERIMIRTHPSRKIHAKLYIFRPNNFNEHSSGHAITGSSNLTEAGLGESDKASNYEFNVLLSEYSEVKFATDEFEKLWGNSVPLPANIFQEAKNNSCLQDVTPFHLYMKFLLEYFGADFDDDISVEWPEGYQELLYQVDAVKEASRKIEKYNGLFLSDVVGLGKTIIASAIAKSYWLKHPHACSILLVRPRTLEQNWEETLRKFEIKTSIAHVTPGCLKDHIEKAEYYDLVIVDESHRFRNNTSERYKHLQEICKTPTRQRKKKNIVLITATPFNNDPSDLHNQIKLFMEGQDSRLTGEPLDDFFADARRRHERIKRSSANKQEIIKKTKELYDEVRQKVVSEITIRRTRTDLKKLERYKKDLEKVDIVFPTPKLEKLFYRLTSAQNKLHERTITIINGGDEETPGFSYMRYQLLAYLRPEVTKKPLGNVKSMSQQLAGLMRVLLFKRMDSSFHAFFETLKRFVERSQAMMDMIEKDQIVLPPKLKFALDDYDDELEKAAEEFAKQEIRDFATCRDFKDGFIEGIRKDHELLLDLRDKWREVIGDSDPKYDEFKSRLGEMMNSENPGRRLVIFTESVDTKEYLSKRLDKIYNCLAISSKATESEKAKVKANFDANAEAKEDNHQILITTDVLAEGVNLHRAPVVVNYDTPWNATRLMQRIGRVNRIGSKAKVIRVYNFFPAPAIEDAIQLEKQALLKLQAFHTVLGEDSQILSEEEEVGSFGIFNDYVEEEEENKTLKLLDELRNFRENDKEGYEKVRRLPLKIRNGVRKGKGEKGKTFVFARTADKRSASFYLVGPGEEWQGLGFEASAELLKADRKTSDVNVHKNHHAQVRKALEEFDNEMKRIQMTNRLTTKENKAISLLIDFASKADTLDRKVLAKRAKELVERRSVNEFSKEMVNLVQEVKQLQGKERADRIFLCIRETMPPVADVEEKEEKDITPTVVISQSYE